MREGRRSLEAGGAGWRGTWTGRGLILLAALLALVAPRFITAAPLDLLQGGKASAAAIDPAEQPGDNFPGSAFFFAEGAFDPVPGADTLRSQHVLGLDSVDAAPSTRFQGLTALDRYRALNCLTSAVYYEAGNEPEDGQRAVAQVVLNRVRNPLWPGSICSVVYQGSERADYRCQFSFSCDGSMARPLLPSAWVRARRIAQDALAGHVYAPVGLATHYHTLAVRPDWSSSLRPVAVIGAHIFYRNPGLNGSAAAFNAVYRGYESLSGPARTSWPASPVAPPEMPREMIAGAVAPPLPSLPPISPSAPAGWTAPVPLPAQDGLPQSTIRPEYRNSGRPLI